MNPLSLHEWNQSPRQVRFFGFNRDYSAAFIRDEAGARRAIRLHLPGICDLRFRSNPIQEAASALRSITRTALHVPPCFASKADCADFRAEGSHERLIAAHFAPWKLVSIHHDRYLDEKDNKELSKRLDQEQHRLRQDYAQRQQEIASLPPERRAEEQRALEAAFTTIRRAAPGAKELASVFDLTLDDAREGWGDLREDLLHEQWAAHHGLNLQRVKKDAEGFRIWLQARAFNAREHITDLRTRTTEVRLGLSLTADQWEMVEASVGYEARFTSGLPCWLEAVEITSALVPQEIEDFDRHEQDAEIAGDLPVTTEEINRALLNRDGKAMTSHGLKKLCAKAGIAYPIQNRADLRRAADYQERSRRTQREKLAARNRERTGPRLR
jgi:hypothetical protein